MYYSFSQALAEINQKLRIMGTAPLSEQEARDYGVVDDMTETGVDDIVREIRSEQHSNACEDKIARERGDYDHLTDYDS